jgi:glycosyltransferase involved in cell wall biosynthesis
MKILFLASSIGVTAGGIVYERILKGLGNQGAKIIVVCVKSSPSLSLEAEINEVRANFILPYRLSQIGLIIFKADIQYFHWINKAFKVCKKIIMQNKPDIIFSIVTGGVYFPMTLGHKLSLKFNIPLAVHSLDPLPSPAAWKENILIRKSVIPMIKPVINHSSFFSMTNDRMLKYELSLLGLPFKSKYHIILNPIIKHNSVYPVPPGKNVFLFLGNFYGVRKPDPLIYGFIKLLKKVPDANLLIAGSNPIRIDNFDIKESEKGKIKLIPYSKYPDDLMKESDILIDMDADIPDDVFISSKLMNYLNSNRVIVSITRKDSPTDELLQKFTNSVITTNHDPENIALALYRAIQISDERNIYDERREFLEEMDINTIGKKIISGFQNTLNP